MNKREDLLTPDMPWLYVSVADPSDITNFGWSLTRNFPPHVSVRFLRGKKMKDLDALYSEFAAALQFPYYFGENWAAFHECLTDLDWIKADAYVLIILNSESVLLNENEVEFSTLIDIFHKVADEWGQPVDTTEAWARPAKAFHIIFQTSPADIEKVRMRLKLVGVSFQEIGI
ncbi:MAG: barstar family protein [Blastocatellia bacterium]|nr:barstar family protein [Blastocatellia bacterium]